MYEDLCMYIYVYVWMPGPTEDRSVRSPWIWSYGRLWTLWHGFWESNFRLLQKQYLLCVAELACLPLKSVSLFSGLVIFGCNNVITTKFQWLTAGSHRSVTLAEFGMVWSEAVTCFQLCVILGPVASLGVHFLCCYAVQENVGKPGVHTASS